MRKLTPLIIVLVAALAACNDEGPTAPEPTCEYAVSTSAREFGSDGGAGTALVTTTSECSWSASAAVPWITIGTASGVGPAVVSYTIAANPTESQRAGAMTIAGVAVTITQSGHAPCVYDVSPQSGTFPADGGSGTITVATTAPCEWTASTPDAWLTIVSGASGRGGGAVSYNVARHTGAVDRTGGITAAGALVRILQLAPPPNPPNPIDCNYSVAPTEFAVHWHETNTEITVTAPDGCVWTVTAGADWLAVTSPGEGSGSKLIRFTAAQFLDTAERRAPVQVRWPTVTAGQNVWVTQEGCRYTIGAASQSFTAAGGDGKVHVFGDPMSTTCSIGCPWTAVSDADWIHIVTKMPDAGDDQLSYRVDANATGQARVGHISIPTAVMTVVQTGGS